VSRAGDCDESFLKARKIPPAWMPANSAAQDKTPLGSSVERCPSVPTGPVLDKSCH